MAQEYADVKCFVDRLARAAGKEAGVIPVVDPDPSKPSALPTPDSYEFMTEWGKKSNWKNECTIKTWVENFSDLFQHDYQSMVFTHN